MTVPICRCGHTQRAHISATGICCALAGTEHCDCAEYVPAAGEQVVLL